MFNYLHKCGLQRSLAIIHAYTHSYVFNPYHNQFNPSKCNTNNIFLFNNRWGCQCRVLTRSPDEVRKNICEILLLLFCFFSQNILKCFVIFAKCFEIKFSSQIILKCFAIFAKCFEISFVFQIIFEMFCELYKMFWSSIDLPNNLVMFCDVDFYYIHLHIKWCLTS